MGSKKIPLNEYGEGNCCPKCGSSKIDVHHQFPLEVYYDLTTGKERFYIEDELKRNPSNRDMARRYKQSQQESQVWYFECRKCDWVSKPFVP